MVNTTTIGNKIAEARKKLAISQAQLAERLFISPQAVGKWERGESMPDITTFNRLAEILGVDLNYFSESFQVPSQPSPMELVDKKLGSESERSSERQVVPMFSGSNLPETDFAGVTAHNGKFEASTLFGSDFSGADLTGSSFKVSDLHGANFDDANLTDCNFHVLNLSEASFRKSLLVRTNFSMAKLDGAKFADVKLTDVKLTMTDLRKTVFENCMFDGVDFDKSDLRGLCLDGQTFIGVTFDNSSLNDTSFKGAMLKNVSFRATHTITNKYYRTLKTIRFDGATMDKLTYAYLKSMEVDLSKVTTI